MGLINDITEGYKYCESIQKSVYLMAKQTTANDFANSYTSERGRYYRYIYPNESELSQVIQHEINQNLKSLNKKVRLFYILAIIALIGAFVFFLIIPYI